ncbi:MAG: hypothetical protein KF802_02485 [Bdellovibrionaceae bacterium]|nr:hypothetical protein [Pseudobdellovibrionaceae bacterium]
MDDNNLTNTFLDYLGNGMNVEPSLKVALDHLVADLKPLEFNQHLDSFNNQSNNFVAVSFILRNPGSGPDLKTDCFNIMLHHFTLMKSLEPTIKKIDLEVKQFESEFPNQKDFPVDLKNKAIDIRCKTLCVFEYYKDLAMMNDMLDRSYKFLPNTPKVQLLKRLR